MKIAKILAFIIFLCSAGVVLSQTAGETKFLAGFKEYGKTSVVQKSNFGENTGLKTEGLKQITRHDFKSKKTIEPRTYLRFSLSVYEYETADSAKTAFDEFREKTKEGSYKSPKYILLEGEKVYWLDGACLYSRQNWEAIETKLQKAILGNANAESDKLVKVLCGGAIVNASEK